MRSVPGHASDSEAVASCLIVPPRFSENLRTVLAALMIHQYIDELDRVFDVGLARNRTASEKTKPKSPVNIQQELKRKRRAGLCDFGS